MPAFHGILERVNRQFSSEHIGELDPRDFDESHDVIDSMRLVQVLDAGLREATMISAMPRGMRHALRALMHANLTRPQDPYAPEPPYVMQFAWAPARHWELQVLAEHGPVEGSGGGITVLIKTPLPPRPR